MPALYFTYKDPIFNHHLCCKPTQDTEVLWKTSLQRSSTVHLCQSPTTHPGSRPSSATRPWLTLSSPACPSRSPDQTYQGTKVSTGTCNNLTGGQQVNYRLKMPSFKRLSVNSWHCDQKCRLCLFMIYLKLHHVYSSTSLHTLATTDYWSCQTKWGFNRKKRILHWATFYS